MQQILSNLTNISICGKRFTVSQRLNMCTEIIFYNCFFDDIGDFPAIDLRNCQKIHIINCVFTNVRSAVYAYMCTGIQVIQCSAKHILGPKPRGQFVQFNRVTGSDNRIIGNHVQSSHSDCPASETGQEDLINLYKSYGDANSPITVACNVLIGPSKSTSAAGICLGDNGGSYQLAQDNYIYDIGGTAITCAGGEHMKILRNTMASKALPNNRVAVDINNYSAAKGTVMSNIFIQGNRANFLTGSGKKYGYWNGMKNANPPIVTEVDNNWSSDDVVGQ